MGGHVFRLPQNARSERRAVHRRAVLYRDVSDDGAAADGGRGDEHAAAAGRVWIDPGGRSENRRSEMGIQDERRDRFGRSVHGGRSRLRRWPRGLLLRARRTDREPAVEVDGRRAGRIRPDDICRDRKSTRLNSSHSQISYAVFCLKKKKKKKQNLNRKKNRQQ